MATSGEAAVVIPGAAAAGTPQYRGLVGTITTMARQEGAR